MNDQPSPGERPSYDVYDAPAHGDVAGEGPTASVPPYAVPRQYLVNPAAPTHGLATASLVLGIIGLASALLTPFLLVTVVGVVCSPFAIWLGNRARREIAADPQAWSGTGAATAGLVTGIVGLVLGVLMLLLVVAVVVLVAGVIAELAG